MEDVQLAFPSWKGSSQAMRITEGYTPSEVKRATDPRVELSLHWFASPTRVGRGRWTRTTAIAWKKKWIYRRRDVTWNLADDRGWQFSGLSVGDPSVVVILFLSFACIVLHYSKSRPSRLFSTMQNWLAVLEIGVVSLPNLPNRIPQEANWGRIHGPQLRSEMFCW